MIHDDIVFAQLPRAGLGNKLLVWAKAVSFAHVNDLPLVTSSWFQVPWGALLRGDRVKSKRLYKDYFKTDQTLSPSSQFFMRRTHTEVVEPGISIVPEGRKRVFIFNTTPPKTDYFGDFREYQPLVKEAFWKLVHPHQFELMERSQPPVVGVHIRRGDFKALSLDTQLGVHHVQTPIEYFVDVVQYLRRVSGRDLPVTLFSDGEDDELRALLELPNVSRHASLSDLSDIMLLSKSKVVVSSSRSTFSYWAGFLADAPLILHPSHPIQVRPREMNEKYWEGILSNFEAPAPLLLMDNLRSAGLCE